MKINKIMFVVMMMLMVSNAFALSFSFDKPTTGIAISGGFQGDLYYRTDDSDISGYKKMSYEVEELETEVDFLVTTDGQNVGSFLFDSVIATDKIDAGIYKFHNNVKVSSSAKDLSLRFEIFMYNDDASITPLFNYTGNVITNTYFVKYEATTSQPVFFVNETARFGINVIALKGVAGDVTLSYVVGNGDGSFFTTPLSIRHSLLRDKNEEDEFQHINISEKTKLETLEDTYFNKSYINLLLPNFLADDNTFTGTNTFGSTTSTSNTLVKMLAGDGYKSELMLYGNGAGTGAIFVGEDDQNGGGISYNGDGSPVFASGEVVGETTFFRRGAGTRTAVFSYGKWNNNVNFFGNLKLEGNQIRDLGDPTLDQDAVTKKYVDDIEETDPLAYHTDENIVATGYNITADTITSYGNNVASYELNITGGNSELKWLR